MRSPSNQILTSAVLTCYIRVRAYITDRQPRGSPCTAQITVSSGVLKSWNPDVTQVHSKVLYWTFISFLRLTDQSL